MSEKKHRIKKDEKYVKEQEKILIEFNDLLNIKQGYNKINLRDITKDEVLIERLKDKIIPGLKTYFVASKIQYFIAGYNKERSDIDIKSLIKNLCKYMAYDVALKHREIKIDGKVVDVPELIIYKK